MVGVKQPKQRTADATLKRLLREKNDAKQQIQELMRRSLTDDSLWAGGDGTLNKRRLLEKLGFPNDICGRTVTATWKAFLKEGIVSPDWKYRLAIILEALNYDSRKWVDIHYFQRACPMYKQAMLEVNQLLEKRGYQLRTSEKAAQFYIRFLKRQRELEET